MIYAIFHIRLGTYKHILFEVNKNSPILIAYFRAPYEKGYIQKVYTLIIQYVVPNIKHSNFSITYFKGVK